ncbi:putative reverse transcriptase domain-containing protein [Tanacetum coccineum]
MDASDLARAEVMSLRTQVVAQHAVITELQVADRRRQAVITEMLAADRRRQKQFIEALKLLKRLQTQMTEFERQQDQLKVLHSQMHQRRLVAVPRSFSSPLSPWSSPLPQIPSPPLPLILSPLPLLPPLPISSPSLPAYAIYPLGYRAAMIWLRAEALSTSHSPPPHIILSHTKADTPPLGTLPSRTPPLLPIPLTTSSPPLHLLSTDRRADRPEVIFPPQKREIMRDLERDVGYGITDTWDEMSVDMPRAPATDDTELGRWMTEFTTRVRKDTDEIYTRLDDEQSKRQLMAGRLNMLYKDRGYVVTYSGGSTSGSDYRATGNGPQETGGDYRDASGGPQETGAVHRGTKTAEETSDLDDKELALLCGRMFPEESDKIEKYVGGLPDMIHGSVVVSKPKTMQDAVEIITELMDKKIRTFAECQIESKRKFEDTSRNTQKQQQQNKRQNTGRAYTAGSGEKKPYGGSKPLCAKCNYHHDGPCAPKCHKCNKVGHFARDCRSTANANNANNQKGTGSGQKPTCYECGVQGHFKRECPKLKNNNNRGNQVGGGNAPAKVYAV